MDFFDNLSEMISSKGKEAKEVAKKVAEIANLKGKISGLEIEVKKNYRKIGEAYYEAYKAAEVTCEFEEYVQAIRDAKKSVEELQYKVNELKGDVVCKGCGSQIKAQSAYCPNCGAKVEVEFFDEEDEVTEENDFEVVKGHDFEVVASDDEVEELEEVEEIVE